MENLSDLINRWQDTCYPGQGRPFKMHKYVSDQTIWLSDSRQGGAKIKTSRNRMESEIVLCSQLKKHDAILEKSAKLTRTYKTQFATFSPATRRKLNKQITDLDKDAAELRDQIDDTSAGLKR